MSDKAAVVAARYMRESDNLAIGYGDGGMLHEVGKRLGWKPDGWWTELKVLNAIDRTHEGVLEKRFFTTPRGRVARVFYLPGAYRGAV